LNSFRKAIVLLFLWGMPHLVVSMGCRKVFPIHIRMGQGETSPLMTIVLSVYLEAVGEQG